MTSFEIYVFILCLIVFVVLTSVFVCVLVIMTRQGLRLIKVGAEDERIYDEHVKAEQRKKDGKRVPGWLSVAFSVLLSCVFAVIFIFTLVVQLSQDKRTKDIPVWRAVYSESMSDKYEKNSYLFENNLNDQFSRFDIVLTYKLPKEEDLKLYDIVVYEVDDVLLIHRIVGIEEPNEKHPNERHFLLQGDLVERPDKFPVRYNQMKAIYRGERIPFIGSFVMFIQSPAGYLCLLLVVVEMISSPLITKKIGQAEQARLVLILKKQEEQQAEEERKAEEERRKQEAEQNALELQRLKEELEILRAQRMLTAQRIVEIQREQTRKALAEQTETEEQPVQEEVAAEEPIMEEPVLEEWQEMPILAEEACVEEEVAPTLADSKTLRIASYRFKKKKWRKL